MTKVFERVAKGKAPGCTSLTRQAIRRRIARAHKRACRQAWQQEVRQETQE